ncbi:hypothetical protein [Oceanibaculum indicum]|uniref:Uncharacterized protein n=1 Tax=Oceanibaculum indicum TaxID=526216 RepID=A0A420WHW3_9PROT|nr:hypothetical protein [Oceanibaculum indicum]RKQ70557.1 hypothetical protein BCL74_2505 [Oceanibaculum indicum]
MLPQTEEQLAKAALCKAPEDIYSVSARELISRHCRSFLDAMRATPTELLFSEDLQKKLENAGTAYSGAVQKVAIAQVSGTKNRDVAGRIKEIFALCDGVRNRTLEAVTAIPVDPLDPKRLKEQLALLPAEGEQRLFRLNLMLARALLKEKGWDEKTALLLTLCEADPPAADMVALDVALSEIIRLPAGLDTIIGKQGKTVGERIALLSKLASGKADDPAPVPSDPPLAQRLMNLQARAAQPNVTAGLQAQMLAAITGTYPMTSGSTADELRATLDVAQRVRLKNGQFLGGETTEAALARRLSRLVNDQNIHDLMVGAPRLAERLQRCLDLYRKMIGPQNYDFLKKYIDYLLQERTVASDVAPKSASVPERLRGLTELHTILMGAPLPSVFRGKLQLRMEEVQNNLLDESGILDRIVKRGGNSAEKALPLIDLCCNDTLIKGSNLRRVRELAQRHIKQPDFLPSILAAATDDADRVKRMQDLHDRLIEAGLASDGGAEK